jgi:hypothetical protein
LECTENAREALLANVRDGTQNNEWSPGALFEVVVSADAPGYVGGGGFVAFRAIPDSTAAPMNMQ